MIPDTPQYLAIQWIVQTNQHILYDMNYTTTTTTNNNINRYFYDDDEAIFDSFKEEYALMVFYYTMNGSNWTYNIAFGVESINKCHWNTMADINETTTRLSLSTITSTWVGIFCNNNSEINKLYIPSNNMIGSMPAEIGLLSSLEIIDLYNNHIFGTMPDQIGKLTTLQKLSLEQNELTGYINNGNWISNVSSSLISLNVANNKLGGTIPTEFIQCTSLQILNVNFNNLYGDINNIYGWTNIQEILLDSNEQITGTITNELLLSLPQLQVLDVGNCNIIGNIPNGLFTHTNLRIVDLHDNSLTGILPTSIIPTTTTTNNIEFLSLNNNLLKGLIDPIIYLKQLQHLDLSMNSFSGHIPLELFLQLTKLQYFNIAHNNDLSSSPIPTEIGLLSNTLQYISFQHTNRIESIPTEIGNLHQLLLLDLASNSLTGVLPTELGTGLTNLKYFMMFDNEITGIIPSDFLNLLDLETIIMFHTNVTDGAEYVCNRNTASSGLSINDFVADCTIPDCLCCTGCCNDSGENGNECNAHNYDANTILSQYDTTKYYEYLKDDPRTVHDEDIVVPP